jgi:hypothetical protein
MCTISDFLRTALLARHGGLHCLIIAKRKPQQQLSLLPRWRYVGHEKLRAIIQLLKFIIEENWSEANTGAAKRIMS